MLGNPERPVGGLAVELPAGVELRPCGRDDLHEAVAMARELRDLPPLTDPQELRERWEHLVSSADAAPFQATADGESAGIVVLAFRRRLNFATFEGWLSDLYVRPAFRGRGIGQALAEAAVAEWRLRQGHRIMAQVPVRAEAARADAARADAARVALEHLGFAESMIDFRLGLSGVPATPRRPPAGVTIRALADGDFDGVTRLIAEFGPHRSPVPDRLEAVRRTFAMHAGAVATGHAGSIVAELDGTTVGVCILDWHDPFWDARRQAWIPDLVVTEPMRGRGIGRALLTAASERAVAAGAAEVVLESGPRRASAHRLYATLGFETIGNTFVLEREA